MNVFDQVPKLLNLDDFEIPKFKICYQGKFYESQLYNFDSMIRLNELHAKMEDEGVKQSSKESFARLIELIFPDIDKGIVNEMPVSFLSAITQQAIMYMTQQLVMAPSELENFRKGIPVNP